MVLVFLSWLISLCIMSSNLSVHVVSSDRISFFLKAVEYSTVFLYHIFVIYSSFVGCLGFSCVLPIMNYTETNMETYTSLQPADITFCVYN